MIALRRRRIDWFAGFVTFWIGFCFVAVIVGFVATIWFGVQLSSLGPTGIAAELGRAAAAFHEAESGSR